MGGQRSSNEVVHFLPLSHEVNVTETVLLSSDKRRENISNSLLAFVTLEPVHSIIVYLLSHLDDSANHINLLVPRRIALAPGDIFVHHAP